MIPRIRRYDVDELLTDLREAAASEDPPKWANELINTLEDLQAAGEISAEKAGLHAKGISYSSWTTSRSLRAD